MATLAAYAATLSTAVAASGVSDPATDYAPSVSSHDGLFTAVEELSVDAEQRAPPPSPSNLVPKWALPLRTRGRYVVDASGRRVRLYCVNWYGAHLEQMVVNGLNREPAASIAQSIVRFGFNCVRLPYSLDMVFHKYSHVPKPHATLAANPGWQGFSPLEVFDATVESLTREGLLVILNNHVSSSGWCCSFGDGEGLWFTRQYTTRQWVDSLALMAERYRPNPLVAGIDLRNEIRPSFLGSPSWGSGKPSMDWSVAAVQGAEAALQQDPDLLIVISGLYYGLFLCDVPKRPVHSMVEALQNRTVYTVHEYKWFNFHLVTRDLINYSFLALLLWCSILLLFFGVRMGVERYCRCCRRSTSCGCRQRRDERRRGAASLRPHFAEDASSVQGEARSCRRRSGARTGCCSGLRKRCRKTWFIFFSALALTGASVAALFVSNNIVHLCSTVMFVATIVTWVLALICGSVSVVLWGVLALRFMERMRQRHLARRESYAASSPAGSPRHEGGTAGDAAPGLSPVAEAPGCASLAGGALATAGCNSERGRSSSSGGSSQGLGFSAAPHCNSSSLDSSSAEGAAETCRAEVFEEASSPTVAEKRLIVRWVHRLLCFVRDIGVVIASSQKVVPWTMAAVAVAAVAHIWESYGRFEVFAKELDDRWGFLANSTDPAPVWLGEFGTINPDDLWWKHMRRYIQEREIEWAYWCINGEQRTNVAEEFGLLARDSRTVQLPKILDQVRELMSPTPEVRPSKSFEPWRPAAVGGIALSSTSWFQAV